MNKVIFAALICTACTMFISCKKEKQVDTIVSAPPQPPLMPLALNNLQLIPIGNLSIARQNVVTATAGTKILFAGGSIPDNSYIGFKPQSRVDIYDTVSHSWTTAELSIPRVGITTVFSGSKIFFAGGVNYLPTSVGFDFHDESRVDIYDVPTNSWSTTELSYPRSNVAAATLGNKFFFAGGSSDFYTSNALDIYDVFTKTWSTSGINSRTALSAIALNNKVYFAGGFDVDYMGDNAKDTKIVEIYDNSINSWSIINMLEAKSTYASIATGNTIFWAGNSNKVEMYDAINGTHTLYDLGSNSSGVTQSVRNNNRILFFNTGYTSERSKRVDVYNIDTKTWLKYQLPQSILNTGIVSTGDKVYVAGGSVNGTLSNQVWLLGF